MATGAAALAATAVTPPAFAQWRPSERYPDPAVEILDPSFAKYRLALASVERLATGMRWCEGPVWFGDGRYLLWSDIPNNRIMRWEEETGARQRLPQALEQRQRQHPRPPGPAGHLRARRAPRHAHRIRRHASPSLIDKFDGKPLNSPNDVVVKSDDSIWFTDPPFGILGNYEGHVATPELPTNVYRLDPKTGRATVVAGDINRPERPRVLARRDEALHRRGGATPRVIRVYDVSTTAPSSPTARVFITAEPGGTPDGFRFDVDGNLWCGWGMGNEKQDGVTVFDPTGKPIGRIALPERCANVCFGGAQAQPPVHGGEPLALFALREHAGSARRPTAGRGRAAVPCGRERVSRACSTC